MTQRTQPFSKDDSKNWFFEYNSQNWTLFSTWLTELIPFFNMTHRNWTHFFWMWPIDFSYKDFDSQKWLILSGKNDSKNWTFFFSTITPRIELFVNDSFNWASFMNLFSIRVELLFLSDSKNWTYFELDSKNRTLFWMWLKNWKFLADK